jgi:cation diffusion facilitator family transporter
MSEAAGHAASGEKNAAARNSVLAAVLLTALKLVVGVLTNSLGIISEAAHSGLDLVAALVTLFAVRIADKPPDHEHQYGHGKVENLSALIETVLLLATCAWIIYEALDRLMASEPVVVDASFWAFAVMATSIAVDVNRSRMLMRAAHAHRSQALEADALHFSTDVWSSTVVIGGLALVRAAGAAPVAWRPWLLRADAVAALVVAGIVVVVSLRLGKRTVDGLLDRAPAGLADQVRAAALGVEHVKGCGLVRIRPSGPITFVEMAVHLAPDLPTAMAHQVAGQVRAAIQDACHGCEATVYAEPAQVAEADVAGQARAVAAEMGLSASDVHLHRLKRGYQVDVDIEVPGGLTLDEAHTRATDYERALETRIDRVARVTTSIRATHVIPEHPEEEVSDRHPDLIAKVAAVVAANPTFGRTGHDIHVFQLENALHVDLHCRCPGTLSMSEVDAATVQLRKALRAAFPQVAHFLVHVEPEDGA